MKNMLWAVILGMLVMCAVIGYDQAQSAKAKNKIKEQFSDQGEYNRGFMEGMNAAIRHIKVDTNSGKASLDIADVLAEMKPPTNAPDTNSWLLLKSVKKSN